MNHDVKYLLKKLFDPQFLQRLPSAIKYKLNRLMHEKVLFKLVSRESVFTSIWRNNYWGSGESLSGPGSTLDYTREIRQRMPTMFNDYHIHSIFDAPCGDFHWMKHVLQDANFSYLGGDIVGDIVKTNKEKFSSTKIDFIKFDLTADVFPSADLWLCRSVFYHLSNRDIYLALEQFAESNIMYILTTNHLTDVSHVNEDIQTGGWRLLNLLLAPFNFPREVLWEIDDYVPPDPAATLTLWTRCQIEAILPGLREIYQR